MSLRAKVVYTAKPHAVNGRCHSIPIEAARAALNDPEALVSSLHFRQCLTKIVIIDHNKIVASYPQTIIHPSEENVVVCTEEQYPHYPAKLSPEAKLVVEMVVID